MDKPMWSQGSVLKFPRALLPLGRFTFYFYKVFILSKPPSAIISLFKSSDGRKRKWVSDTPLTVVLFGESRKESVSYSQTQALNWSSGINEQGLTGSTWRLSTQIKACLSMHRQGSRKLCVMGVYLCVCVCVSLHRHISEKHGAMTQNTPNSHHKRLMEQTESHQPEGFWVFERSNQNKQTNKQMKTLLLQYNPGNTLDMGETRNESGVERSVLPATPGTTQCYCCSSTNSLFNTFHLWKLYLFSIQTF